MLNHIFLKYQNIKKANISVRFFYVYQE